MTFFARNAEWIGYLTEIVIRKCVALSIASCSGCKDDMQSDLLHLHNQMSLLEKLEHYFEQSRAEVLTSLNALYHSIEANLPHSDDKKKDMGIYINVGKHFLITCSPQALYYGRYVNDLNDTFIADVLAKDTKAKPKNKGRVKPF
jgi:hypothetical protein